MKKQLINYETMIRIAKGISRSKDPEEAAEEGIASILSVPIFVRGKGEHPMKGFL